MKEIIKRVLVAGKITTKELRELGYSKHEIDKLVRSCKLERIARGCYDLDYAIIPTDVLDVVLNLDFDSVDKIDWNKYKKYIDELEMHSYTFHLLTKKNYVMCYKAFMVMKKIGSIPETLFNAYQIALEKMRISFGKRNLLAQLRDKSQIEYYNECIYDGDERILRQLYSCIYAGDYTPVDLTNVVFCDYKYAYLGELVKQLNEARLFWNREIDKAILSKDYVKALERINVKLSHFTDFRTIPASLLVEWRVLGALNNAHNQGQNYQVNMAVSYLDDEVLKKIYCGQYEEVEVMYPDKISMRLKGMLKDLIHLRDLRYDKAGLRDVIDLENNGWLDAAIQKVLEKINEKESFTTVRILARLYKKKGDGKKARICYQRLADTSYIKTYQSTYNKGLEELDSIINSDDVDYLIRMANKKLKDGYYDDAFLCFYRVIGELKFQNYDVYMKAILCCFKGHNYEQGLEYLNQVKSLDLTEEQIRLVEYYQRVFEAVSSEPNTYVVWNCAEEIVKNYRQGNDIYEIAVLFGFEPYCSEIQQIIDLNNTKIESPRLVFTEN